MLQQSMTSLKDEQYCTDLYRHITVRNVQQNMIDMRMTHNVDTSAGHNISQHMVVLKLTELPITSLKCLYKLK